jgi:hemerythrin
VKYGWDESYEIGFPVIDAQHRQLFDAFNEFVEACDGGRGYSEIEKTMEFLHEYTIRHFMDEEKIQQEHRYPDYHQHKRFHDEFKIMLRDLKADFTQKGPTADVISRIQTSIGDWISNHIKVHDMKIGKYIRAREKYIDKLRSSCANEEETPPSSSSE